MLIKRIGNELDQHCYSVELSEYDAIPPAQQLQMDHAPRYINPERQAIACYLTFGPWCGGDFQCPNKIGPATARAIIDDVAPLQMNCNPIEYYPKPLPEGVRALLVSNQPPLGQPGVIHNLRSDLWNGSLREQQSLTVATNSFIFKQHENDYRPDVAIGVLFAEELGADTIELDAPIEECELIRIRRLLSAVRLGFEIYNS